MPAETEGSVLLTIEINLKFWNDILQKSHSTHALLIEMNWPNNVICQKVEYR